MKHKAFTNIIAHSCRVPGKTVVLFARNLKEAGLLTTGARGVNAPEMTVLDLTRMVIALCATDRPSDAVEMSNRYRVARSIEAATITVGDRKIAIPAGEELEDFLSAMLGLPHLVLTDLGLGLFIHWNRLSAEVWICEAKITFKVELTKEETENQRYGTFAGITTTRGLASQELTEMAVPFYLEKEDGTTWEEMIASGTVSKVAARHIFRAIAQDTVEPVTGERS
jgi:hypothetical protein